MVARPAVVAFDIIETVFRIEPLGPRLAGIGLPAHAFRRLYAEALRDAVAMACTGRYAPFQQVFKGALATMLAEAGLPVEDDRMDGALSVMRELPPQPGAREAFAALTDAGIRVIALSNGARTATEALLAGAGLRDMVEPVLSTDTVSLAKPRPEVYRHACEATGTAAHRTMLVACHPWDIGGAKAAGLSGGYVARGKPYPPAMLAPDVRGEELPDVARAILALPA